MAKRHRLRGTGWKRRPRNEWLGAWHWDVPGGLRSVLVAGGRFHIRHTKSTGLHRGDEIDLACRSMGGFHAQQVQAFDFAELPRDFQKRLRRRRIPGEKAVPEMEREEKRRKKERKGEKERERRIPTSKANRSSIFRFNSFGGS